MMAILPVVHLCEKRYENYPVRVMSRMEAEEKIRESGSINTVILRRSDNSIQANPDVYFVLTRMENFNRPSMNIIVTHQQFEEADGKLERLCRFLIPDDQLMQPDSGLRDYMDGNLI